MAKNLREPRLSSKKVVSYKIKKVYDKLVLKENKLFKLKTQQLDPSAWEKIFAEAKFENLTWEKIFAEVLSEAEPCP